MAVDKKAIAAMGRKKSTKKGSTKKGTQTAMYDGNLFTGEVNSTMININEALRNKDYRSDAERKYLEKELKRLEIS